VNLEATVTSDAPASELLILVEDKNPPIDPMCRLKVNGKEATLSSGGSETGWAASLLPKPERWLFLTSPLPQGKSRVSLNLLTRGGAPAVSAWVWAKKGDCPNFRPSENGTVPLGVPNALPQPELISLDGAVLLKPVDETAAAKTTRTVARPIDRIDGVFLDAMDPSLLRQTLGGCEKNASVAKTPIVIAGRRYWRGLGVNCPSRTAVALDGKYRRFQALAGLDSEIMNNYMDRSAIAFEVWVDGRKRWDSGPVRNADPAEPAKSVDIDVAGAKLLELVVVAQDVHGHLAQNLADWAEARLLKH
jgi:NPCBM/NEW2 domain